MIAQWNLINKIRYINESVTEASGFAPANSAWFSGHFPGEPILPGIALISAVYDTIRKCEQDRGEKVSMASLKRIRFTGPVRPGDTFLLNLNRENLNGRFWFNFKINVKESTVCSGLVAVFRDEEDKIGKKEEENA
ncbi:MAG: hypothetical protein KBA28_11035 [Syntrophaceae bacterium]|nr:hypothetical protein [Syntrophaceae bacterium]HOC58415.1 hypothetical protein [Smithellaceae bacterium]HQM45456.1 hypothetical protein [Smithellaceae bacterium]